MYICDYNEMDPLTRTAMTKIKSSTLNGLAGLQLGFGWEKEGQHVLKYNVGIVRVDMMRARHDETRQMLNLRHALIENAGSKAWGSAWLALLGLASWAVIGGRIRMSLNERDGAGR